MKPFRTIVAALALTALPGLALAAGGPVTPANQDDHYNSLFTPAADDCLDLESITPEERDVGCTKAMDELKARRAAATNPTVAERTNYDFYESLLHIARASTYFNMDGKPSERVCKSAESSWALHYKLLSVPESSLSAKSYASIHDVPKAVRPVLTSCRSMYGKPADATPLPSA